MVIVVHNFPWTTALGWRLAWSFEEQSSWVSQAKGSDCLMVLVYIQLVCGSLHATYFNSSYSTTFSKLYAFTHGGMTHTMCMYVYVFITGIIQFWQYLEALVNLFRYLTCTWSQLRCTSCGVSLSISSLSLSLSKWHICLQTGLVSPPIKMSSYFYWYI